MTQITPQEVAQEILDAHEIRPEFSRDGAAIAELIAEAVERDRASRRPFGEITKTWTVEDAASHIIDTLFQEEEPTPEQLEQHEMLARHAATTWEWRQLQDATESDWELVRQALNSAASELGIDFTI